MAVISQFTRPAKNRIIKTVLKSEQLPNRAVGRTGALGGFALRGHQQELHWVIANEDISTDEDGDVRIVNDDGEEVSYGDAITAVNRFHTTVWRGVLCSAIRVRGELRITDAYTAKTLLCVASGNVTALTETFAVSIVAELDGNYKEDVFDIPDVHNVFQQTIGVGELLFVKWNEDDGWWFAFKPGGDPGTEGMTPGCGLENDMGIWNVVPADLAGEGLKAATGTDTSECAIDIDTGCGVYIDPEHKLSVKHDCTMVCSEATDFELGVDISNIAGDGLIADIPNCEIDVDYGCGLEIVGGKIQVKYGAGLNCVDGTLIATGITSMEGCGIDITETGTDETTISVDPDDLAGDGLTTGPTACYISIDTGCGLKLTGISPNKVLEVDAGDGLFCSGTAVHVGQGCGITVGEDDISVNAGTLAGNGLFVSSGCTLAVGKGCGISVGGDVVSIAPDEIAGAGLVPASGTSGCLIDINYGCGLDIVSDVLKVKASDLVGAAGDTGLVESAGTSDCGIAVDLTPSSFVDADEIISCDLEVIGDVLRHTLHYTRTTFGLNEAGDVISASVGGASSIFCETPLEACAEGGGETTVSAGFAMTVTPSLPNYQVAVNSTALKGGGILVNGSQALEVNAGAGLNITSDAVTVGSGLGITANANDVQVNAGVGLTFSGSALVVGAGSGIIANADDVQVNAGAGLTFSGNALIVGQGNGITVSADAVAVNAGAGLTFSGTALIVGQGGGITVNANDIAVNAGPGLFISGAELAVGQGSGITVGPDAVSVNFGCGLTVNASNQLRVLPDDIAGDGLVPVGGGACSIKLNLGCGLEFNGDVVQVNYGAGLTCINGELQATGISFTNGCGIIIDTGTISVDHGALAGSGLVAGPNCQLDVGQGNGITVSGNAIAVNPGCGLKFSGVQLVVDNIQLAPTGSGLVTFSTCGVKVNNGCGIAINASNQVTFDAAAVAGNGLIVSSGCILAVGTGCGITVGTNSISVDASALAGSGLNAGTGTDCQLHVDPGCGLKINSTTGEVEVDVTAMDGPGLTTIGACGLTIDAGCGLGFDENKLIVDASDLAGTGLSPEVGGSGCGLRVNLGCGLRFDPLDADAIAVNNGTLAGNGLIAGPGCRLDVVGGCGIVSESDAIRVDGPQLAGAGLASTVGTCQLNIVGTCGITVNANDIAVNGAQLAGNGLTSSGTCVLAVGQGCGITVSSDTVSAKVDGTKGLACDVTNGLQVKVSPLNNCLTFDTQGNLLFNTACGGSTVTAGCGINVNSSTVSVDNTELAGDGLLAETSPSGTCKLGVRTGCGVTTISGVLRADPTPLAGQGLMPTDVLNTSICSIMVNLGCGLKFGTGANLDKVEVNNLAIAGGGLTASGTDCSISVGAGCGITVGSDTISVNGNVLRGNGLTLPGGVGTCTLAVGAGPGITVGTTTVSVKSDATKGLVTDSVNGVQIKLSTLNNCLKFDPSGNLQFDTACAGSGGTTILAGCGINVSGTNPATISVNRTALAGPGLTTGASTCDLTLKVGGGIKFDTGVGGVDPNRIVIDNVALQGQGLTVDGTYSVKVNPGCGLKFGTGANLDKVEVDTAALVGTAATTGLATIGSACAIQIDQVQSGSDIVIRSINSVTQSIDAVTNRLNTVYNYTPITIRKNAAGIVIDAIVGSSQNATATFVPLEACP